MLLEIIELRNAVAVSRSPGMLSYTSPQGCGWEAEMYIDIRVRFAVWGELAKARREAKDMRAERLATRWALGMERLRRITW